ncbi:MAG: hypothetical protein ACPHV3_09770, partial [Vibrio sp.]
MSGLSWLTFNPFSKQCHLKVGGKRTLKHLGVLICGWGWLSSVYAHDASVTVEDLKQGKLTQINQSHEHPFEYLRRPKVTGRIFTIGSDTLSPLMSVWGSA